MTPGLTPHSAVAPGTASRMCHASVFPLAWPSSCQAAASSEAAPGVKARMHIKKGSISKPMAVKASNDPALEKSAYHPAMSPQMATDEQDPAGLAAAGGMTLAGSSTGAPGIPAATLAGAGALPASGHQRQDSAQVPTEKEGV